MTEETRDIKRLLVEFNTGQTAVLESNPDYEWVINCVPRFFDQDEWGDGVKSEIRAYVSTWLTLYGALHSQPIAELRQFLAERIEDIDEWLSHNQDLVDLVEREGLG